MEKGKEVLISSVSGAELPFATQKKRKCTIFKFVVASIITVAICYILVGGSTAKGKCDLFRGRWILNPNGPSYNNTSCHIIDDADNCLKNGRPDTEYLYWRWQPYFCDLPPFDAGLFMNAMRDKSWAFIGDSILRNQMQSLVCLLSKIEEPVEIYHDEAYKSRTFYFPNHNLTIATIWAPFLVKSSSDEGNDGKSSNEIHVYLDNLETNWATDYHEYDYIVISGGQWFLKSATFWEENKIIGCHNCANKNLEELGIYYPYRKALQRALCFVVSSDHKPFVVFRTWTTDHFEYGEWYNGGICNRSKPYKEGQFHAHSVDDMMRAIELDECKKANIIATGRGIEMEVLDIFHLSILRPDGHPGPYRQYHPFDKDKSAKVQNDCLHWCLPGPVDTWNELMMKIMLDAGAFNSSTLNQSYIEGLQLLSFQ